MAPIPPSAILAAHESDIIGLTSIATNVIKQIESAAKSGTEVEKKVATNILSLVETLVKSVQRTIPFNAATQRQSRLVMDDAANVFEQFREAAETGSISSMNPDDIRTLIESGQQNAADLLKQLQDQLADTTTYRADLPEHRKEITRLEEKRKAGTATPAEISQLTQHKKEVTKKEKGLAEVSHTERALADQRTVLGSLNSAAAAIDEENKARASLVEKLNKERKEKDDKQATAYKKGMDTLIPGSRSLATRIKEFSDAMQEPVPMFAKLGGVFLKVTTGLITFANALASVAQKMYAFGREFATPLQQVGAQVTTSFIQSIKSIGKEASFSNKQYMETVKSTQNVIGGQFGKEETSRITVAAAEMGVSPEEMIGASYAAYGTMGRSYKEAEQSAMGVRASFDKVGLTGRKAFQYMKENAFLLAVYGQKFVGSIAESAAKFAKMGLDIQRFKNLSDDIVLDFGSFIDKTAELGATIPGLQLDVATISQKAFMEGPIAVADELQKQLSATGKNFADLPYFQQMSLRQTLGLDEAALAKLMGTEQLEDIPTQSLKAQEDANTKLERIANDIGRFLSRFGGLGSIATILGGIATSVGSILTLVAANSILKNTTSSGILGTVGKSTIGKGVLAVGKGLGFGAAGYVGGELMDKYSESLAKKGNTKGAAQASVGGSMLRGAGYGAAIGSVVPVIGTATGAAIGAGVAGAYGLYKNWGDLYPKNTQQPSQSVLTKSLSEKNAAIGVGVGSGMSVKTDSIPADRGESIIKRREQVTPKPLPSSGFLLDTPAAKADTTKAIDTQSKNVIVDEKVLSNLTAAAVAKAISTLKFNVMTGDVILDGTKVGTMLASRIETASQAFRG